MVCKERNLSFSSVVLFLICKISSQPQETFVQLLGNEAKRRSPGNMAQRKLSLLITKYVQFIS